MYTNENFANMNIFSKYKSEIIKFSLISFIIIITFLIWGNQINELFDKFLEQAEREENHVFVRNILFITLASDILLPIPSSLASTLCGYYLGFWEGFLISFMAMNISSFIGYFLGRFFTSAAKKLIKQEEIKQLEKTNTSNGVCWILAMRPIPVLAEASILYAGIKKFPLCSTAWGLLLGNATVSAIYALLGTYTKGEASVAFAFIGVIIVSGIFWIIAKAISKRSKH